jgi:purine-binding chemotaxis protein CheW
MASSPGSEPNGLLKFNRRKNRDLATAEIERRDQYLAFTLGGETFAMGIGCIKEVIQFESLTQVPLMPGFLRGVINLRGSVVPVIDVFVRFGRPSLPVTRRSCVVIVEVTEAEETAVLGIMVDSVSEVLEIGASEIEPTPAFGSDIRASFIAGVGRVGNRFVLLLDPNQVLSVEEMSELAGARGPGDDILKR